MKRPHYSPRVLRAAALFGVAVSRQGGFGAHRRAEARRAAAELELALPAGGVAFVTGPSGGGKSTLLRALRARLRTTNRPCVVMGTPRAGRGTRAVLDTVPGALAGRLGSLARAGLAEPRVWGLPVGTLSDGQRARAALARAMAACERKGSGATLLADEFCSTLDRTTAWCVAASVARWAREGRAAGRRVVVAAANGDLLEPLAPDVLVHIGTDGRAVQVARAGGGSSRADALRDRFTLRTGTLAEASHLLSAHYRSGGPGPVCGVRLAVDRASGDVCGALVVSRPTLNGPWRTWLAGGSARERARRVNARLRVISRVVIDPRWRGCGLATRLVRSYLACPLTLRTEALAAMGEVCPLFTRAGMTATRVPPTPRDARLRRELRRARCAPWRLAAWHDLPARVRLNGVLERSLRRWANDSRATRHLARGPLEHIARAAAGALGGRVVFQHVAARASHTQGKHHEEKSHHAVSEDRPRQPAGRPGCAAQVSARCAGGARAAHAAAGVVGCAV